MNVVSAVQQGHPTEKMNKVEMKQQTIKENTNSFGATVIKKKKNVCVRVSS